MNPPGRKLRLLDCFCGRFGWGRAFAARGWEVVGIDLVEPPEVPEGCEFVRGDILTMECYDGKIWIDLEHSDGWEPHSLGRFDFICASSPCEEFSVWNMRMFHPNPPYPELGIKLFNHTRSLCEGSQIPYVMENVKGAQQFVGRAQRRCGPFHLWGNAVPLLLPQGITKGIQLGGSFKGKHWKEATPEERKAMRKTDFMIQYQSGSKQRKECTAKAATIPDLLANCVAEYAERLIEQGTNFPVAQ